MSNFIIVPINENGVIYDSNMDNVVAEAMAEVPFGFQDVYVYSHGWSTDAYVAMDNYSQFSVELSRTILRAAAAEDPSLANPPLPHLGVGIHWPSEITEDPSSSLNNLQLLTFYTMGQRAETVGRNAVYAMLRLLLESRKDSSLPLRFFILGHSFGCRVVCAALNDLQVDIAAKAFPTPRSVEFRVVLLEAAFDDDNMEPGDIYGAVPQIQNLRMLMTTSMLDEALGKWYPAASALQNLFHKGSAKQALGFAGPTAATVASFGGENQISVPLGFRSGELTSLKERLIVGNLSPAHQSRKDSGTYSGGFSGSHSDIYFEEVYQLVMGFLFS